jgi:predicted NBD/HSP70 family sugar kinase
MDQTFSVGVDLGGTNLRVAASAMVRMMSEASMSIANAREVAELANAGDETAQAVLTHVGQAQLGSDAGLLGACLLPLLAQAGQAGVEVAALAPQ